MTPTTAEQMPDFNLIAEMLDTLGWLGTTRHPSRLIERQAKLLRSWLAQGGARGVPEDMVIVPREIVANYAVSTGIPRHRRICDAALAPRAEAGEHEVSGNGWKATWPKEPTAACGVSGLADHCEDLLGMVRKWRASANRLTDNAVEGGIMAGTLHCADELEAALKANRGGVSEAMVAAFKVAFHAAACRPEGAYDDNIRLGITAALNAGARAGGEVVDGLELSGTVTRIGNDEEGKPRIIVSTTRAAIEALTGNLLFKRVQVRSLVVGGVG